VIALAGCGRVGFRDRGVDASELDAEPPPDAPRVLLETLVVPSDGTRITSTTVLALGDPYVLVASGTFVAVPPAVDPMADAEYWDMTDPAEGPKDLDTTNNIDFGLAIDVTDVGPTKTPQTWGAYRSDHTYTVAFTGRGATLSAVLFDCCYNDNIGALNLAIYR
jgi:hypothetical protein